LLARFQRRTVLLVLGFGKAAGRWVPQEVAGGPGWARGRPRSSMERQGERERERNRKRGRKENHDMEC
jgi:hypothetical protein